MDISVNSPGRVNNTKSHFNYSRINIFLFVAILKTENTYDQIKLIKCEPLQINMTISKKKAITQHITDSK